MKRRRRGVPLKSSIRLKIMMIYIVIFLPIFLITVLAINQLSNSYMQRVNIENNTLVVKNTLGQIDDVLRDMERISLVTIADEDIQKMLAEPGNNYDFTYYKNQKWLEQFFQNIISIRDQISTIRIVRPDNSLFYRYDSQGRVFNTGTDYMNSPWVKACRRANGRTVFLPTSSVNDLSMSGHQSDPNWLAFSVARQINRSLSNQVLGYMKIDTSLNLMDTIIRQYKQDGSEIIICDRNKQIVYDRNFSLAENSISRIFPKNTFEFHTSGSYQIKIDGVETFTTFMTSSYSGWTMICLTPKSVVFGGIQNLNRIDIFIVLFAAFIAVALSALMSKAITKNIVRLNHSMKKVQTGNLDVSLAPRSNDEIGELTVTFNTMVNKLKLLIQQDYIVRIRNQELEIKHRKAQYQALLNQINPHFLYNTLDVIRITAALNGDSAVERMLFSLSRFFRLNLAKGDVTTTLRQELELARVYLEIYKFRVLDIRAEIVDRTNPKTEYQVPRFILQPIIENAINHGMEGGKGCVVTVLAELEDNRLKISVSDNGVGMSEEQIRTYNTRFSTEDPLHDSPSQPSSGIGMTNVNQRIRLMYGTEYGMRLVPSIGGGLTVMFSLPVIVL